MSYRTAGAFIALLVLVFDQWSKWYVFGYLEQHGSPIEVLPFFNLVHVENRGISFGMFNDHDYSALIFSCIGGVITIILFFWLNRAKTVPLSLGLGCIIGGAVGNIIDRIRMGAVADFLDFYWGQYHWPAFNIADSAIFIGAVCLGLDAILEARAEKSQQKLHKESH
ncbi:MAG: lspA [Rickettsiales bacterium]|nr:lspA [Rickettsiales bacterium]